VNALEMVRWFISYENGRRRFIPFWGLSYEQISGQMGGFSLTQLHEVSVAISFR
jgi:hypothetical protein